MSTNTINPSFETVQTFAELADALREAPPACKTKMAHNDYVRLWHCFGALGQGETTIQGSTLGVSPASAQATAYKLGVLVEHIGLGDRKSVRQSQDRSSFHLSGISGVPAEWGQDAESLTFIPRGRPRKVKVEVDAAEPETQIETPVVEAVAETPKKKSAKKGARKARPTRKAKPKAKVVEEPTDDASTDEPAKDAPTSTSVDSVSDDFSDNDF